MAQKNHRQTCTCSSCSDNGISIFDQLEMLQQPGTRRVGERDGWRDAVALQNATSRQYSEKGRIV